MISIKSIGGPMFHLYRPSNWYNIGLPRRKRETHRAMEKGVTCLECFDISFRWLQWHPCRRTQLMTEQAPA
jgi:hypothetical protein